MNYSKLLQLGLFIGLLLIASTLSWTRTIYEEFDNETRIASLENITLTSSKITLDKGLIFIEKHDNTVDFGVFRDIIVDGNYIYVIGHTESGGSIKDGLILKFNKDNLELVAKKTIGLATNAETLTSLTVDSSYIYAVGWTESEGNVNEGILVQLDKDNLSLVEKKKYGGPSSDKFFSIANNDNYLFISGTSSLEGFGEADALILKIKKSDLSINARKVYGNTLDDVFYAITIDNSYAYATGYYSDSSDSTDGLIVVFDINDLTIMNKKAYNSATIDHFLSIDVDNTHIFVTGRSGTTTNSVSEDAFVAKISKIDLSVSTIKSYGGNYEDMFTSIFVNSTNVYVAGFTKTGSNVQGLVYTFQASDLTLQARKEYDGTNAHTFWGIFEDNGFIYLAGGEKEHIDTEIKGSLLKIDASLPSGTYISSPTLFTIEGSTLSSKAKSLTTRDNDVYSSNGGHDLSSSTLSLSESTISLSDIYSYPPYPYTGIILSKNLLAGQYASSIKTFSYNISSLPSGSSAKVQFSIDNSTWYDSYGVLNGWETLSSGSNSINLIPRSWSGTEFYYKLSLTSTLGNMAVLDSVDLLFENTESPTAPSIGENSSVSFPTTIGGKITWKTEVSDPNTDENITLIICDSDGVNSATIGHDYWTVTKQTTSAYDKDNVQLVSDGTSVYYVWVEDEGGGVQQIWTSSADADGSNWSATKRTSSSTSKEHVKVVLNADRLYLLWSEKINTTWQLLTAYMYTNGSGWSTTQQTSSSEDSRYGSLYNYNNKLYIIWDKIVNSTAEIWTAKVNKDGSGWTQTSQAGGYRTKGKTNCFILNTTFYCVWSEQNGNDWNIYSASFNTNLAAWTSSARTFSDYNHTEPKLFIKDNTIHYIWTQSVGSEYDYIWTASMGTDGSGFTKTRRTMSEGNGTYTNPSISIAENHIYYLWEEINDTKRYIWNATMRTDKIHWQATKLRTINYNHTIAPQFLINQSTLYTAWSESDGSKHQIYTAVRKNKGCTTKMLCRDPVFGFSSEGSFQCHSFATENDDASNPWRGFVCDDDNHCYEPPSDSPFYVNYAPVLTSASSNADTSPGLSAGIPIIFSADYTDEDADKMQLLVCSDPQIKSSSQHFYLKSSSVEKEKTFNIAHGDFDGDGFTDYVVLTRGSYCSGGFLRFYKGNNTGIFTSWKTMLNGEYTDLEAGDLDSDGDIDLVVTAWCSSKKSLVLKNDGSGNFFISQELASYKSSEALALKDIDADTDLDIVISNFWGSGLMIYKNDGSGTFTETQTISGTYPGLVIGDIDGDNDNDIIVGRFNTVKSGSNCNPSSSIQHKIYKNDGTGSFSESQTISGDRDIGDMAITDVDGDNDLDFIATTTYCLRENINVYENDGTGSFSLLGSVTNTDYAIMSIQILDFENDGDNDFIVSAESSSIPARIYINDGAGSFSLGWESNFNTSSFNVHVGDLNGDSIDDVIIGNHNEEDHIYLKKSILSDSFTCANKLFCQSEMYPQHKTPETSDTVICSYTSKIGDVGSNSYATFIMDEHGVKDGPITGTFYINSAAPKITLDISPNPVQAGDPVFVTGFVGLSDGTNRAGIPLSFTIDGNPLSDYGTIKPLAEGLYYEATESGTWSQINNTEEIEPGYYNKETFYTSSLISPDTYIGFVDFNATYSITGGSNGVTVAVMPIDPNQGNKQINIAYGHNNFVQEKVFSSSETTHEIKLFAATTSSIQTNGATPITWAVSYLAPQSSNDNQFHFKLFDEAPAADSYEIQVEATIDTIEVSASKTLTVTSPTVACTTQQVRCNNICYTKGSGVCCDNTWIAEGSCCFDAQCKGNFKCYENKCSKRYCIQGYKRCGKHCYAQNTGCCVDNKWNYHAECCTARDCTADKLCIKNKCIAKPTPHNGVCETNEDWRISCYDCGCPSDKICVPIPEKNHFRCESKPADTVCTQGWPSHEGSLINMNNAMYHSGIAKTYSCDLFEVADDSLHSILNTAFTCCKTPGHPSCHSFASNNYYASGLHKKITAANVKQCLGLYLIYALGPAASYTQQYYYGEICSTIPHYSPEKCQGHFYTCKPYSGPEKVKMSLLPWAYPTLGTNNALNYWVSDTDMSKNSCLFLDLPAHVTLQVLKTGTCVDYSIALTTLLRMAGYKSSETFTAIGPGHAYNMIKLPGDSKFHIVDTVGNRNGPFSRGKVPAGYPYCTYTSCANDNGHRACPATTEVAGC